ncbi:hypothetical protein LDG_5376 [Legionella drancourtii LLAP12]|uniref:Uncharacterized protein n=1 Tax=Legionella drancourtii LLAP12 TaxID=658187 RepID=G9EJL0_9GAMM|nr:hypothetical protein LDG_5376 [Legionella drancourtii LLAP12]
MSRYLVILLALCVSLSTHAWQWQDLWSTPDQQGQDLLAKKKFNEAQQTFTRNDWAATAAYRAGDYQKATALYQELKNEQGYYNSGNALAHLGQYEEAIKAYDKALTLNPANKDAIYNRKLVANLLKRNNKTRNNKTRNNKTRNSKTRNSKTRNSKTRNSKTRNSKTRNSKRKLIVKNNRQKNNGYG